MPATPYLKNAWAKKDAEGGYWLFIKGGDLQAIFRLIWKGTWRRLHSTPRTGSMARRSEQYKRKGR